MSIEMMVSNPGTVRACNALLFLVFAMTGFYELLYALAQNARIHISGVYLHTMLGITLLSVGSLAGLIAMNHVRSS